MPCFLEEKNSFTNVYILRKYLNVILHAPCVLYLSTYLHVHAKKMLPENKATFRQELLNTGIHT